MNSHDIAFLTPWLIAHGYLFFLIVATIEGPITTIAAGAATSLGYFNIYGIIGLAILADIGGDVIYFGIGYMSHNLMRLKFFRILGLTEKRIENAKIFLQHKTWRAVFLAKISPFTGPFGTIALGAFRPKFQSFFWSAIALSVVKSTAFVLIGYYFVQSYLKIDKIVNQNQYTIIGAVIVIILAYYIYIKVTSQITKKLAK